MKVFALSLAAAAVVLVSAPARAQQADYSGTWELDRSRSESATQSEPSGQVTLVVTMSPSDVTIERREGTNSRTVHYRTDGAQTTSTFGSDRAVGTLRWDGGKLVTETVYQIRGIPLAQTEVRTLSSDGREMTVETGLLVVHGYEGQRIDEVSTPPNFARGKDTYVRR